MKIIFTTVGTSLFTNYMKRQTKIDLGEDYTPIESQYEDIENNSFSVADFDDEKFETGISRIKKVITQIWLSTKRNDLCAEIQTIENYLKESKNNDDFIVELIATDTVLSRLASELIRVYLNNKYPNSCNFDPVYGKNVIEGLVVKSKDKDKDFFQKGIMNLVKNLNEKIEDAKKKEYEVVLNISGGYKGIIPILTLLGQKEDVSVIYQYIDGDEVLEVSRIPLNFDWTIIEENYTLFEIFLKQQSKYPDISEIKNMFHIEESDINEWIEKYQIFKKVNNSIELTSIGSIYLSDYQKIYNETQWGRQNILGALIELKIYEYYCSKYNSPNIIIENGKKIGQGKFEIDIYFENNEQIRVIEVKPGNHIPWDVILKKFMIGAFHNQLQEWKNKTERKKLTFEIVAYHYRPLYDTIKDDFKKKILNKITEFDSVEVLLTWLKVPQNYKKNVEWKVNQENLIQMVNNNSV